MGPETRVKLLELGPGMSCIFVSRRSGRLGLGLALELAVAFKVELELVPLLGISCTFIKPPTRLPRPEIRGVLPMMLLLDKGMTRGVLNSNLRASFRFRASCSSEDSSRARLSSLIYGFRTVGTRGSVFGSWAKSRTFIPNSASSSGVGCCGGGGALAGSVGKRSSGCELLLA